MQDQLAETKERYRQASGGVTERTRTLTEVTEELEGIKQQMDDRGTSMTDGGKDNNFTCLICMILELNVNYLCCNKNTAVTSTV